MRSLHFSRTEIDQIDKTPIVLLHGFLESSEMWDHVEFPIGHPIIRIDLPGHGKSNHPELLRDSIEDMANAVIDVLDEINLIHYHIIGHSMGGYVALEVKKKDARAKKVMLLNSNFWSDSPQKVKDRIRVAEIVQTNQSHFIYEVIPNLFLNPQEFDCEVKSLISEAMEISPDAIGKASIAMSTRRDFSDYVREHSRDFTCIQGIEDAIVPMTKMRESLKGSTVNYVELKGVGHMAHFEAPKIVNETIDTFLK